MPSPIVVTAGVFGVLALATGIGGAIGVGVARIRDIGFRQAGKNTYNRVKQSGKDFINRVKTGATKQFNRFLDALPPSNELLRKRELLRREKLQREFPSEVLSKQEVSARIKRAETKFRRGVNITSIQSLARGKISRTDLAERRATQQTELP